MNVFRKIGVLAAIAALPGLLSGPLTAQQWDVAGQSASARAVVLAPPVPTAVPTSNRTGLDPDIPQTPPLTPAAGQKIAPSVVLSGAIAPFSEAMEAGFATPATGSPALPVGQRPANLVGSVRNDQANPRLTGLAQFAFRLEDAPAIIAPLAGSPLVTSANDRLSPDHLELPGLGSIAPVKAFDPVLSAAPVMPEPAESVSAKALNDRAGALEPGAASASEAALLETEVDGPRTRMFGPVVPRKAAPSAPLPTVPVLAPPTPQKQELAPQQQQNIDMRPGAETFPAEEGKPAFTIDDEVDYQIDDQTIVSGQAFYSFRTKEFGFGGSAVREFDKFTLAIDGNYAFEQKSYSIALRLGLSFGRDPLKRKLFIAPPGQASSGAVSLRAFQDIDGNGTFGTGDVPLKDVEFSVFNNTASTDKQGVARLMRLGNGNPVAVQVDPSSLPDIMMAPASRGIEIVPRSGRFHVMEFPIVALSEIEGTITFEGAQTSRGVSGLRLVLMDEKGNVAGSVRTERGGYYFFEQIKPGTFKLVLDPDQAAQLGVCLTGDLVIKVMPTGDIYNLDAVVRECA